MPPYSRVAIALVSLPAAAYRTGVAVLDGTTAPAANAGGGIWAANPGGFNLCRVFVTTTGSPVATFIPYVRSGGTSGSVGQQATQTLGGTPNFSLTWDVIAGGDDVAILAATLSTGTFTVTLSWR